eukprot:3715506-Amphidinium_carterae.1
MKLLTRGAGKDSIRSRQLKRLNLLLRRPGDERNRCGNVQVSKEYHNAASKLLPFLVLEETCGDQAKGFEKRKQQA